MLIYIYIYIYTQIIMMVKPITIMQKLSVSWPGHVRPLTVTREAKLRPLWQTCATVRSAPALTVPPTCRPRQWSSGEPSLRATHCSYRFRSDAVLYPISFSVSVQRSELDRPARIVLSLMRRCTGWAQACRERINGKAWPRAESRILVRCCCTQQVVLTAY